MVAVAEYRIARKVLAIVDEAEEKSEGVECLYILV